MSKHTPGKWTAYHIHVSADCGNLDRDGYNAHCIVEAADGRTEKECIANARLIAAAPELLDALKAALKLDLRDNGEYMADAIVDMATAAIAAAEGKEGRE